MKTVCLTHAQHLSGEFTIESPWSIYLKHTGKSASNVAGLSWTVLVCKHC